MGYSQRRARGFVMSEGAERHQLATGGWDEDVVESLRAKLELGIDFHNDVILIHALVNRGDLSLAKGVVQRAIDGAGSDTEAAGRVAVDHQSRLQAAILQIGVHIADERQGA